MACVALPTCGLALAESERLLPDLVTALEGLAEKAGLKDDDIVIRMTGCPNGCARPYLAEIGLVGRNPGLYNLYLGAAFDGSRLNKLYAEDVGEAQVVRLLEPIFTHYAKDRKKGERFGDFVIRAGYVEATKGGNTFHADVKPVKVVS
jgi:sulfite reductase (NADPH) hemoprotein beta-component